MLRALDCTVTISCGLCVFCAVVVLTGFVMCVCVSVFSNMCACIYCVLYCLYCVFVLFRLCILFVLSVLV